MEFPNPYLEKRKISKGEKQQQIVSYVLMLARWYPGFRKLLGVRYAEELDSDRVRGAIMGDLMKIMAGGWFKGYRTQILGWATVMGTVLYAVVQWMVGDVDFWGMLAVFKDNWEALVAGYGLVFVGDKIDEAKK